MSQAGIIDVINSNPQIPTMFTTNSGTAIPLINDINILGTSVPAGTTPVETTGAGNTVTIEVQTSQAISASNASNIGLAAFDSASFTVDANGFVTLTAGTGIESFLTDSGAPAVEPNASGQVSLLGGEGMNVTGQGPGNTITISGEDASDTNKGVASFDVGDFTVTAGNVVLNGSGVGQTITGQSGGALSPTAGNWNIFGGTVVAGTSPVVTSGSVSTLTVNVQRSQAIAAADTTKVGLSNFDSAAFDVDANGFVQLNGGGIASTSFDVQTNTAPGTDPVVPTAAGVVTVNGAAVANHSVVLETRSRAANAYNLEIQYATSAAATDATKSGVAHFDSTSFSVDANGFVQSLAGVFTWTDVSGAFSPLKNNGYFITATATGTLPVAPSQGDTIKFFVDHATQVLTIDAPGTQLIRMGSLVTSAGGTAVSTSQGDSVELVYRSANTCWEAVCGFSGTWIIS